MNNKTLSSGAIEKKESRIPSSAGHAFRDAQSVALSNGLSVVVASNGKLVRVDPNGKRTVLKSIEARVHVPRGFTVKIK